MNAQTFLAGCPFTPDHPFTVSGESEYRIMPDGSVAHRHTSFGWLMTFQTWPTMDAFRADADRAWNRAIDPENHPRPFPRKEAR